MFDLGLFSKYRAELMGIATILILMCHMPAHGVVMPSWAESMIVHGGSGCDMFLFLSGLGMYRSYNSRSINSIRAITKWLYKRYLRLFVPYLMIAIPCIAIDAYTNHLSTWQFLLQLSTFSFWIDGKGLWFIALLVILYLITPVLNVLNKHNQRWIIILIVLLTWMSGSIKGLEGPAAHLQFGLCRMPNYMIGFIVANDILCRRTVKLHLCLFLVTFGVAICAVINKVTCLQISYFWLEGLFLMMFFSLMLESFSCLTKIMALLRFVGSISLESYCTNVLLLFHFHGLPFVIRGINLNPGNWTFYLVGTTICIMVSIIINRLSKWVLNQSLAMR